MAARVLLCVCLLLLSSLTLASAAIPIPGKLLVSGSDGYNPIAYFMIGDTDSVTPASVAFYGGDISPDGTQVVYNVGVTETLLQIWRSGIDGSGQTNLTQSAGIGGVSCAPQWSPDGSQIAFHRSEPVTGQLPCDAGFHVWIMNADGSGAHRVTPAGFSPTRVPVWSPDGHQLLCEADWLGIITMDTDGSNAVVLPNVGGSPAISPDGSKIASSQSQYSASANGTYRRLLLTDADGSDPETLVERFISDADVLAHLAHLGLPADDFNISVVQWNVGPGSPRWAPTSDMIAYSAAMPLDVQGPNFDLQREVWIYGLATSTGTQVTDNSWCDAGFSWHGNNTYPDYPEVTVDPVTVTFSQVTAEGLTTIIRDDTAPAPPDGHWAVGSPYRIETTAATAGPTTVRVTYPEGIVSSGAENHLALLRYDEGAVQWEGITASRDTASNAVTGQPSSLGLVRLSLPLPTGHFSDVPSSAVDAHWALWEIEACVDAGIVSGYPDGTYQPSASVTRDQMAVFLVRALGQEPSGPVTPQSWKDAYGYDPAVPATWAVDFTDVPASGWGSPAGPYWAWFHIQRLYELGVTQGVTATEYGPAQEVSRDQMAVFLIRALGQECANPCVDTTCWAYDPATPATWAHDFADIPATGQDTCHGAHWAWFHIQALYETGVTLGCGDGTNYCPADSVRRDEMAAFLARAFLGM